MTKYRVYWVCDEEHQRGEHIREASSLSHLAKQLGVPRISSGMDVDRKGTVSHVCPENLESILKIFNPDMAEEESLKTLFTTDEDVWFSVLVENLGND